RRRHTRFSRDWSSDVCSSDLHSVAFQYFNVRDGSVLHEGLIIPVFNFNNIVFAFFNGHAFYRLVKIEAPAAQIPEAESLEAEFDASFISNQFPHVGL